MLLLFLLQALTSASFNQAEALKIDVIYESLCPDSTRFNSHKFPPMYEAIGDQVTVNFRPYGFAEVSIQGIELN